MASASNHHNSLADRAKLFPLKSISDVVKLFRCELESGSEPDLTLLSIVAGFIENTLTSGNSTENTPASNNSHHVDALSKFPIVTFEVVDKFYKKFQSILLNIDKIKPGRYANRQIIKKVSDVIWHSLIRSTYKDRAHLQNLYSYLSANKLDCFGVAFAVVAGCQLLGYKDVHLAISEDHAWVVFGKNRVETVEVTWHGKGHEDKRGQDVSAGIESRSWLYLAGCPVRCDRYIEVAAIVSAINISLTLTSDCLELADLQQNLLWLLYDMGHLQKYPMGLGSLGELEEVSPTQARPSCEVIYKEATKSAQVNYKNHHVYPYTYQGAYYYRQSKYREAFASWANAGDVIRLYNYSRDDEEIYKEFQDIANEMIPHVMKTESSGHSARSILRDSECFANLLRFYDGICQWEEGSLTPILHIGWAKPLVNTISKFDYEIRSQVVINCGDNEDESSSTKKNETNEAKKSKDSIDEITKDNKIEDVHMDEGNNNCIKKEEINKQNDTSTGKKSDIPTLADLTAACGEKILNPDFLLQGGGQPFADQKQKKSEEKSANKVKIEGIAIKPETVESEKDKTTNSDLTDIFDFQPKRPVISLSSQKMKGLKDLLLAEKLNTHAISLQVTAQSQTAGKKVRGDKSHSQAHSTTTSTTASAAVSEPEVCTRPKRTRRE